MQSLNRSASRIRILIFVLSLTSVLSLATVSAQEHSVPMEFMSRMNESMEGMDRSMKDAPMDGDVDHDFASMMIPHHEGAIEMAKAELLYGKDPVMRRLAQEIIVDQKSEVDAMNLWLAQQTKSPHKETKR